MKKKSIFILLLSFIIFMSCSDDDDNDCITYEEIANVTDVQAPETATVNETVDVTVTFQVKNSCGEFARFDETVSGMTRTVAVEALYEGCNCAQVITSRTETYTFTITTAGEHLLRFRTAGDQFIERTITVPEPAESE